MGGPIRHFGALRPWLSVLTRCAHALRLAKPRDFRSNPIHADIFNPAPVLLS